MPFKALSRGTRKRTPRIINHRVQKRQDRSRRFSVLVGLLSQSEQGENAVEDLDEEAEEAVVVLTAIFAVAFGLAVIIQLVALIRIFDAGAAAGAVAVAVGFGMAEGGDRLGFFKIAI